MLICRLWVRPAQFFFSPIQGLAKCCFKSFVVVASTGALMKTIETFPSTTVETTDMGIPLPDGTRLSARVWMPDDAMTSPVPAILEYLPYRKSDGTVARDQLMHSYIAGHGYICLRVDRRGCGDSQGLFDDEYSEEELRDGVEIINWIAAQPWCDGNVGMQGISWGGFNALQIAALAPEHLKAIITIGSTVDRYADDIHYKGGLQLCENIGWAATSMSWLSTPPDPQIAGNDWRKIWLQRLEAAPFLASTWVRHKDRDSYWKHGSVCEDYTAIKAAVLCAGGLHDGYRNTMAHLAENLEAPVKAIAGPWNHKYPFMSTIGPSIGFLQEALRWWDHWLKKIDRGVEKDPDYRVYLMDSIAPAVTYPSRPGRWITEDQWPSPHIATVAFVLGEDGLSKKHADNIVPVQRHVPFALSCGQCCGEYFPFGFGPGELPDDQTADDAHSCCFDSTILEGQLDIVGAPKVHLKLSADQSAAQVIVRLCDLRPDGTSAFISYGMLNLRHRNSFETPQDITPGQMMDVVLVLDQCAYALPKGHRLRIAVSSSYWPLVWPEAQPFQLTLSGGQVELPIRPLRSNDTYHFDEPEAARPRKIKMLRAGFEEKNRTTDPDSGETTLTIEADHGRHEDLENGLISQSHLQEKWTIHHDDPSSARAEIEWTRSMGRGEWEVSATVTTHMSTDTENYFIVQTLKAFEGDNLVFEKTMQDKIPR